MTTPLHERTAHLVDPQEAETVSVLGPTLAFLTPTENGAPCVLRGTIPAEGFVPLHSHGDPETFFVLDGAVDGLVMEAGVHRWVPIRAGDVFHVPGYVPHAWRNLSQRPATMQIVTTARIGAFFREVGTRVTAGADGPPPTDEDIRRFHETAARYGYWNATPEENAQVGIPVDAPE